MNGDDPLLLLDKLLDDFSPWLTILKYAFYIGAGYGAIKCLQLGKEVILGARTYFFHRYLTPKDFRELYGKWAVVTGATSAIGEAFAYEFASRGLNVVLISRSVDKLIPIVSTIQSEYNVQAYGIHADFFLGQHVFSEIEQALLADKLDIGILVNTNPIHYDHPQYFSQVPPLRLWQIVNVNVAATTMMSHVVLPRMLSRGRGAIINLSTCLSSSISPLEGGSLASKVYVNYLGRALHEECRHKGITIQTLTPWKVSSDNLPSSFFIPSPDKYVTHALQTLGVSSYCCGYWPHGIIKCIYKMMPGSLWIWLVGNRNRAQRQASLIKNMNTDHLFARKPRKFSTAATHLGAKAPLSYPPSPTSTKANSLQPQPSFSDNITTQTSTSSRRTQSVPLSSHEPHQSSKLQRSLSRVMVVPSVARSVEREPLPL